MDKSVVLDQSFRKSALRPKFGRLYYWYWFRFST